MFAKLNSLFENDGNLAGQRVLLIENGSDAGFVLHHFLSAYVKLGLNIVFVPLLQSFSHYNNVGNKLSVSLSNAKEHGSLVVIEAMKILGHQIASESLGDDVDSSDIVDFKADKKSTLKPLYLQIKTAYEELSKDKSTLIIIDDLSVLLGIGVSTSAIYFFVKYLGSMLADIGGLLVSLHCGKEDDDAAMLACQLHHQSTMYIQVRGLDSGYCKDVHGEIMVDIFKANTVESCACKTMQFRILDKNLSLFAVGTSAAVL